MEIGLLLCGHPRSGVRDRHGDFTQMFQQLLAPQGIKLVPYDVEAMDFPSSVQDHEGWLLSGSKHGAYDPLDFIPPLEGFIRDAFAAQVPMVGICFGHQIIAQALGGRVIKWPGGWNIGRRTYDMGGLGQVDLAAWHQDQVTDLPAGAEVIARAPGCAIAGVHYPGRALTLQPHPEFDLPILGTYAAVFRDLGGTYPADQLAAAAETTTSGAPLTTAPVAEMIARFFQNPAGVPTHV